jgi:hypothetical protein
MHSPLSSFLVDLVQSHGYGVEDVTITDDSARCMHPMFCLSNAGEEDSACDTEEQNGPLKRSPSSFDMLALAESVVVEVKKVSRWESVSPPKNTPERKRFPGAVAVVIGLRRGPSTTRTRPARVGSPKRTISLDSTLSLPERKESMDNLSCHNARGESPKQNASFDKPKAGSRNSRPNQAKNASAIARAILFA